MKVKIYGAGSIGNHLAQAYRRMGWSVDICDIDRDALIRTKNEIYPSRYGEWDKEIGLYHTSDVPISGYDMIIVGTPPDSHMKLAISAVKEGAKIVLVEKPLSTPDLFGAQELFDESNKAGCNVFVGYDHAISKSSAIVYEHLQNKDFGEMITLDVEFREFWGGIFNAHPWLDGPSDTYLGFWEKGGGACGEHSHAINLFQKQLPVSLDSIKEGIRGATIEGRLQVLSNEPYVVADVAHNIDAAINLYNFINMSKRSGKVYAVFSILKNKDIDQVLMPFINIVDEWFISEINDSRTQKIDVIINTLKRYNKQIVINKFDNLTLAYNNVSKKCGLNDNIIIYGSFFTVSEILNGVTI